MIPSFVPSSGWPADSLGNLNFSPDIAIPAEGREAMWSIIQSMVASETFAKWVKGNTGALFASELTTRALLRLVIEYGDDSAVYGFGEPLTEKRYLHFQKPRRSVVETAYGTVCALSALRACGSFREAGADRLYEALADETQFLALVRWSAETSGVAPAEWARFLTLLDIAAQRDADVAEIPPPLDDAGAVRVPEPLPLSISPNDEASDSDHHSAVVAEPDDDEVFALASAPAEEPGGVVEPAGGSGDEADAEEEDSAAAFQIVLNEYQATASASIQQGYQLARAFLQERRRAPMPVPGERDLRSAHATKFDTRWVFPGILAISGSAGVGKTTTFLDTVIGLFASNATMRTVMPCAFTHNAAGEIRKAMGKRMRRLHEGYECIDTPVKSDTLETTIGDRKVTLSVWRFPVNGITRYIVRPNTIMSTFSAGGRDDDDSDDDDGFSGMGSGHPFDLVAIDEASMPPASMVRQLALNSPAPLLLTGDPGQIPPIEENQGKYDYFTSAVLHGFRGMLRHFVVTAEGPGFRIERVSYRFARPVDANGEFVVRQSYDVMVGDSYRPVPLQVDVAQDNPLTGFQIEGSGVGKVYVRANRTGADLKGWLFSAEASGDGRPIVYPTHALAGFGDLMDAPSLRTSGESGGILDLAFRVRRHTDLPSDVGITAVERLDVTHVGQPLTRIESYIREAVVGGRGVDEKASEEAVREFASRYVGKDGEPSGDGVFICGRHSTRSSLNQRVRARLMDSLVGTGGVAPIARSEYLSPGETLIVEGARKVVAGLGVVLANNEFLRVRQVHNEAAEVEVCYEERPNRLGMGISGLEVGERVPATISDEPVKVPVVEARVETRDGAHATVQIPHWFLGQNGTSSKDRRVWEEAYRDGYYRLRSKISDILNEIREAGSRQRKGLMAYPLLALFDPREMVEIPIEGWSSDVEMREQAEEVRARHALGLPVTESYIGRKWVASGEEKSFPLGVEVESLAPATPQPLVIHVLLDEINAVLKQLGYREVQLGMQPGSNRYITIPVRSELLVALYAKAELPTGPVSGVYLRSIYRRPVEKVLGEPFSLDLRQRVHLIHGQFSISPPSYVLRYNVDRPESLHTGRHIQAARHIDAYRHAPLLIAHYGYAVTGHASQGSEFPTVYAAIDPGSLRLVQKGIDETNSTQVQERYRYMQEVLRWIYVVCTRAQNRLTFIDYSVAKYDPEKPKAPAPRPKPLSQAEVEAALKNGGGRLF